jgi:D-xylose transport system substrate-binding protein
MKKLNFVLVAILLLMCGCNLNQTFKNQDNVLKIGFIYESMTVERWLRDQDIFVAKAETLGAQVIVKDAYESSERQDEIGRGMIDQGVDVLVIVPYDKNSLRDLISYAHSQNVKVISYDRMIKNANVDFYISFDNNQVGYLMGKSATDKVPKGNYLILNGSKTDNNSFQLNAGYYSLLQPLIDKGDIKVVGETWVEDWRAEGAYDFVSKTLNSGQKIDAVIAADDQLAEGAVTALSENKLAGKVFVTGQDAELSACQRIVEGTQNMTVYKPISVLAEGAAELAVKMASGVDVGLSSEMSDGTYNVHCQIYAPILVTKDNIGQTVIKDGFFTEEQIYANVPQNERPAG